ncbi:MAG: c-type cytochrome [Rhodospirillaceae bacterium]
MKERMDAMEVIKDAAKALKGGLVDGNGAAPEAMRAEAQKISDRAGEALLRLYPEGSRTGVTEAKAEIWTDWERFAELAHLFKARADAVVAEPTKATFVPLAQTCKTCHEDFKAED